MAQKIAGTRDRTVEITRIAAGFVFLSAAVFRVLHHAEAVAEVTRLHLPAFASTAIVVFEVAVSTMFFLNIRVRVAALATIAFLFGAIAIALALYWREILASIHELFVFNANPTDILLHVMYILFLIILFRGARK